MVGLTRQLCSVIKGENSSRSVGDTDCSNKTSRCEVEKYFIGMEEDTDMLESLARGDEISDLVISICRMGGFGKTIFITNTEILTKTRHRPLSVQFLLMRRVLHWYSQMRRQKPLQLLFDWH